MSWKDDIENKQLIITTGDGVKYFPLWKEATKQREYNVSVFEFINVEGSLVRRAKPKGLKLDLNLYFVGDNCIDEANNFEISARDKRRWIIEHPLYGKIYVHPLSMLIDNTEFNVTKVTVPVIETLLEKSPQNSTYPQEDIQLKKITTYQDTESSFDWYSKQTPPSIQGLKAELVGYNAIMDKALKTTNDINNYKKLYRECFSALDNVASTPLVIIRTWSSILDFPSTAQLTVQERLSLYSEALSSLTDSITAFAVNGRALNQKIQYETLGSYTLASALQTSTNGTYDNADDVQKSINIITDMYEQYIETVESSFTETAGDLESYTSDYKIANDLNILFNTVVSNLFDISLSSKQKRSIILENDSNLIILTHRFYGLDNEDLNIDKFIKDNKIGLNEIYNIKKGREVIYYV